MEKEKLCYMHAKVCFQKEYFYEIENVSYLV